jgi:hypothetical protein
MKATRFFIALCLFLLGGKVLDAGAVYHAHQFSFVKVVLQDVDHNRPILETSNSTNETSFLFSNEVDDEDEKNSLAKKSKELNKFVTASSTVQFLHSYYKAPKAVTAHLDAGTSSPRYILLRTLRI